MLPGLSVMEHAVLMLIHWEYLSSWVKKEEVFVLRFDLKRSILRDLPASRGQAGEMCQDHVGTGRY